MSKKTPKKWDYMPEILYEAPQFQGQKTSPVPYISVPKDKDMPEALFIMEYKETGEFDVGDSGQPEEIVEGPIPHMFIDFKHLENVLLETFPDINIAVAVDKIRVGLGLKPLQQARREGEEMIQRVVDKVNAAAEQKFKEQQQQQLNKKESTN